MTPYGQEPGVIVYMRETVREMLGDEEFHRREEEREQEESRQREARERHQGRKPAPGVVGSSTGGQWTAL